MYSGHVSGSICFHYTAWGCDNADIFHFGSMVKGRKCLPSSRNQIKDSSVYTHFRVEGRCHDRRGIVALVVLYNIVFRYIFTTVEGEPEWNRILTTQYW